MKSIKSFMSLAIGFILTATGLLLIWGWTQSALWGVVPLVAGVGLMLMAVPFISILRERAARFRRWLPAMMAVFGFVLFGAISAALIALGIGENRRIAAQTGPAPGVIALIRPAALLGVAEAAQHLGLAYYLGQDGPKDLVLARYWTSQAAEAGNTGAQLDLARFYAKGVGGPKDGGSALVWAQKAAAQGLASAHTLIGNLYLSGGPLPEDAKKANAAFARGSELGEPEAMFNLGVAYEYGNGVAKDPVRAFELYRDAAQLGLSEAQLNLGVAYMNGAGVPADDNEARAWLEASKEGAAADIRALADENLAIIASRQA
jgi:TPR repeat protein